MAELVERHRVGGDCLWTGCVPSKALLASAKAAHTMRVADHYGLPSVDPEIDTSLVWKRLRAIQQEIASTDDNPERFEAMGVEVVYGTARVTGPNTVSVLPKPGTDGAERELETRIILLATGSRPATPPIEGLRDAGWRGPAGRWASGGSRSTSGCARRSRPSTPAATWPAGTCSPTRPAMRRCGPCGTPSTPARER